MKKIFLDGCIELIKNNNKNISNEKLEEVRYGLEGIYLAITKTIFIFAITYFLGIFKEMLIMLIIFNILRTTGFGLHAKKSWQCWISSTILFVLFPFISNYIEIPLTIRITAGILSIVLMFFYAPADTYKHPLVNAKKRLIWKYITTINTFILVCISIFIKNNCIANLIIFAIYTEILLINPISYKLLDLPYNNYKKLV